MLKKSPRYSCIALVYNSAKPKALAEAHKLKAWLTKKRVRVFVEAQVTSAMKAAQLIIAMGGDGTVLAVTRDVATWGVPVLGVNIGHLGFLAATELRAATSLIKRVLSGEGRLE